MGPATHNCDVCGKTFKRKFDVTLPYLSSSLLVEHKARHRSLHRGLSMTTSSAALQLCHPISSLSFSAVLLQVSFGRPRFRLPSGVHVIAILVSSSLPFLNTCPIYRHLLILILSSIVCVFVLSLSCWLLILFGQYIRSILLRHLFWNASHILMSPIVILQHSDPYINTDSTLLLKIFTLVSTL